MNSCNRRKELATVNKSMISRKSLALFLLAMFASIRCGANPLILSPTGTTLTTGQFRAEAAISPGNERGNYMWLAAGLSQFEASVIRIRGVAGEDANVVGAQWCFLPETFVTPAVSLGVSDIGSQTAHGPGVYFAASKRISTAMLAPLLQGFSATLGIGVGGIRGLFASFEANLPAGLFVQGEYDSRDLNGAIGWQPLPALRLKVYSIRKDTYYGAELVPVLF